MPWIDCNLTPVQERYLSHQNVGVLTIVSTLEETGHLTSDTSLSGVRRRLTNARVSMGELLTPGDALGYIAQRRGRPYTHGNS